MISKSRTVIRICIAIFFCSFLITILGCPCNCNFELYKYTGVIISNFPEWLSKYKYVNKFSEWKEWDSEHNLKSLFLDKYDKFDYKGMYRLIVEGQILGIEFDNGDSYVFMFSWLKPYESNKDINFVGNMEARELMSGDYDIVVADGFAGNVLLKSTEGAMKGVLKSLKAEIKSRFISKIGALFMRKSFKNLKGKFDYKDKGGAVLLGCKKLLVKAHGNSKARSIAACIEQMYSMHKGKLIAKITDKLGKAGIGESND